MIVQNEVMPSEAPEDIPVIMESKKYLVVKNHVREICEPYENINIQCGKTNENVKELTKKTKKRKKYEEQSSTSDDDSLNTNNDVNIISESDLEELRTIYKKCKSVLLKIESKYGHLLNLDNEEYKKRKTDNTLSECKCTLNNKVVFSEDGQTQSIENSLEHHICPSKFQINKKHCPPSKPNILIESQESYISLPHTIQELEDLLKNTSLQISLRNKVIEKIKYIRHMNSNMIRFDKQSLIEKLKSNPDEIIDFKGTNISSIVGYPTKPA